MPIEGEEDERSLREELEAAFETDDDSQKSTKRIEDDEDTISGGSDPAKEAETDSKDKPAEPAKTGKEPGKEPAKEAAKDADKPKVSFREPPSRWSKEAKELWAKTFAALDDKNPTHKQIGQLRDMIFERNAEMEADYTRKTQEVANERKRLEGVMSLIEPRRAAIEQMGSTVEKELGTLLQLNDYAAQRPYEFLQWFVSTRQLDPAAIAQAVGLQAGKQQQQQSQPDDDDPLGIIPQKYKDALAALPQLQATIQGMQQQLGQVGSQWQGFQAQQQQAQLSQVQDYLRNWINEKDDAGNPKRPFYNDVKGDMIAMLEKGIARDYDHAYAMAVAGRPDISQKLRDSEHAARIAEQERRNRERVSRKEAAGASVFGGPASGQGAPRPREGQGDSLRAILESAWDENVSQASSI